MLVPKVELNITFWVHVTYSFVPSTQLHYSSKPAYNTAEQREYVFYLSLRFNMAATTTRYVTAPCVHMFSFRQTTIGSSFRLFDAHQKPYPYILNVFPYLQLL